MSKILIKICGLKTPEQARQAALAGADFIGLVFHPDSPRYVDMDQARSIIHAIQDLPTTPVAVFVNQTTNIMQHLCESIGITTVQLHGSIARREHGHLPQNYARFYVRSVSPQGALLPDVDAGQPLCDPHRDVILLDNIHPGGGQPFTWTRQNLAPFRFCLAGGLRADNVQQAINLCQPQLVDVSSGVEDKKGHKNTQLLTQFIQTINKRSLHS